MSVGEEILAVFSHLVFDWIFYPLLHSSGFLTGFQLPNDKSMDKFDSDAKSAKCSTFAHCHDDPFASMTRVDFIKPKPKKSFLAPRHVSATIANS